MQWRGVKIITTKTHKVVDFWEKNTQHLWNWNPTGGGEKERKKQQQKTTTILSKIIAEKFSDVMDNTNQYFLKNI